MSRVQGFAKEHIPPLMARTLKRFAVQARCFRQQRESRIGYSHLGKLYPHPILFVAGLPKSGTTWLEKMLSSYPGFQEVLMPDATWYELSSGGSHDYELPDDFFDRFQDMLVVSKMHVHGSLHNATLLRENRIRYVILYRDLRDVAVSYYFYVRQTPWHPENPTYRQLDVRQALWHFAATLLLPFANWVRSWQANRDPQLSLMFRYEEMLADTVATMTKVAEHFKLDSSRETVQEIVEKHSFKHLSGGRNRGEDNTNSFFRKGVAGDWQNHFGPEVRGVYKELIGDFLIEFGYEQDRSW